MECIYIISKIAYNDNEDLFKAISFHFWRCQMIVYGGPNEGAFGFNCRAVKKIRNSLPSDREIQYILPMLRALDMISHFINPNYDIIASCSLYVRVRMRARARACERVRVWEAYVGNSRIIFTCIRKSLWPHWIFFLKSGISPWRFMSSKLFSRQRGVLN